MLPGREWGEFPECPCSAPSTEVEALDCSFWIRKGPGKGPEGRCEVTMCDCQQQRKEWGGAGSKGGGKVTTLLEGLSY